MATKLTFLGAVGTVTGSKYLLEVGNTKVLVDCGLFQGFKQLRLRNRAPLQVDPRSLTAVALTHAHLDHSGYLPLLVRNGFSGPIISTPATRDLCEILLPDSGYLQEKDAEYANRHGFSKHHPALPLYTVEDAEASLEFFKPLEFNLDQKIGENLVIQFQPAGHILGAAITKLSWGAKSIVFSGDLGRANSATMLDPALVRDTDYLVVESTYGDRSHDERDPEDALSEIITKTAARGGIILIPSFAVGRAQTILYHLHNLKRHRRIPDLPVFLDSPMAIDASELFCRHVGDHRLTTKECRAMCGVTEYVRDWEQSKALDHSKTPMVLISASGMATGGRILHHLKHFGPDHRNAIVFAGFQAAGTRGAAIAGGADKVKIHGGYVPIRADVHKLDMLSAHADADEILEWLKNFDKPPRKTFVTHGEPSASDTLRLRIEEELDWECVVPEYKDEIFLD